MIKTKLLNDIQDVKQDIVMNSKVQHVDKDKDHAFSSSDVWHCLPPDSNFEHILLKHETFQNSHFQRDSKQLGRRAGTLVLMFQKIEMVMRIVERIPPSIAQAKYGI